MLDGQSRRAAPARTRRLQTCDHTGLAISRSDTAGEVIPSAPRAHIMTPSPPPPHAGYSTMKILDVRITGLSGGTVDGGWPQGNKPEEDLNTLVEVVTDEGLVGVGSAMTSKSLVTAGGHLLRPHLIGQAGRAPGPGAREARARGL